MGTQGRTPVASRPRNNEKKGKPNGFPFHFLIGFGNRP